MQDASSSWQSQDGSAWRDGWRDGWQESWQAQPAQPSAGATQPPGLRRPGGPAWWRSSNKGSVEGRESRSLLREEWRASAMSHLPFPEWQAHQAAQARQAAQQAEWLRNEQRRLEYEATLLAHRQHGLEQQRLLQEQQRQLNEQQAHQARQQQLEREQQREQQHLLQQQQLQATADALQTEVAQLKLAAARQALYASPALTEFRRAQAQPQEPKPSPWRQAQARQQQVQQRPELPKAAAAAAGATPQQLQALGAAAKAPPPAAAGVLVPGATAMAAAALLHLQAQAKAAQPKMPARIYVAAQGGIATQVPGAAVQWFPQPAGPQLQATQPPPQRPRFQ